MDVDRVVARQLVLELADRLEERQALDVAYRAADLDQHEVVVVVAGKDEVLDGIGDVRHHLDGRAEIIAAPLLGQDVLVDAPGGDVVGLGGRPPREAFVMAEIEIGLGAVIRHEDFAVLIRRHRAWIEVEIGVELAKPNLVTAGLKQGAQSCRCQTLTER